MPRPDKKPTDQFSPAADRAQVRAMLEDGHPTDDALRLFRRLIYRYFNQQRREFTWRNTHEPYAILVSEVMLQQTQTSRVEQKYETFLEKFPNFRALAESSLGEVLELWQGLGYNRRARMLRETAQGVYREHEGELPDSYDELIELPGIGPATASAVLAFAFDEPIAFLETNIRRVYLFFFFPGQEDVRDTELLAVARRALDHEEPRRWHYALMDYGAALAERVENPNRRSARYRKQAPFEGSNRQIRGAILRALLSEGGLTEPELVRALDRPRDRVRRSLDELLEERMVREDEERYVIA
jgi:A/G-specific adenine glycosylase